MHADRESCRAFAPPLLHCSTTAAAVLVHKKVTHIHKKVIREKT